MKDIKIENILHLKAGPEYPFATLLLQGDEVYLERELKEFFKKSGSEIKQVDMKKSGPEASWEDYSMGTSLFSTSQILWAKKVGAPSKWNKNAHGVWDRMKKRADGRQFTMILQTPLDKRISYTSLGVETKCSMHIDPAQKSKWIKLMAQKRKFALNNDQLRFLSENFDEPLLVFDQWIDLWQLGGDFWAEAQLGWRTEKKAAQTAEKKKLILGSGENPAYLWVDAVLRGQHRQALKLIDLLLEGGEDPIKLIGLLAKSVRIMAHLERGQSISGHPDFMVSKIRAVLRVSKQKYRGARLLRRCVDIDRKLKSSSTAPRALLSRLSL